MEWPGEIGCLAVIKVSLSERRLDYLSATGERRSSYSVGRSEIRLRI